MKVKRRPTRFGWVYACAECGEYLDSLENGLKHPTKRDIWPLPSFLARDIDCQHIDKVCEYPCDPPIECKEIHPHL